ncbi:hypothetical protein, partial [Endozoicomonas sp. SESOKO1]|uniref:hypothetical protein n=1 Tax=Endozoicomonas sp. SESOKO1 TaxID=2828742 RepID=UPI00214771E5
MNNQLSLSTSDTAGYLHVASADSMDQLVARAMNILIPLAQQYDLGLTQPVQIANGRGIGHLYQPTDAEITELADLAPIPTSALTLKQILTKPVTELEALDKVATKALAKQYVEKVTSANGLKKLKLSQKLTEQDLLPSPSSTEVTTADPLIMQMREVISVLDDALANNTPVPDAIKKLNAHIMAKTSQSLLARARGEAPADPAQPAGVPSVSQPSQAASAEADIQYSLQLMVLKDAINAIAPEVPGAALLAHPSGAAVPGSSGGQASGSTDPGLSAGAKAGIVAGSVGGALGSVASGAFLRRLASNGGNAAAEDVGVSIGESAAEEFVPETEVLKSLGEGLSTNIEDLMAKAPAPPNHEPGGDWTHIRSRGKGSRGKIKEPACRRKRALAGAGMGRCAADELYDKAVKRVIAEGVIGFSAPALMAGFAETLAVGVLTPELLMIIAAVVAGGVAGWVGYEIYELVEDGKKKGGGGDSDDSSDNDNSGHHHSSGGSGNRGTTPTSGLLTTGQPPVTGLQPATGRPGSDPGVVANSSNTVALQIAPGSSSLVLPDITASEVSLTTVLWSETAAPALVAGLSSSASTIEAAPGQSESTRAQALSANTTVPMEAESSSSANTIKTSLSPSEMASSQSVSSSITALASSESCSFADATSTTAAFSPELSSSMNTTDVSMMPSGMASTQALSSNTTAPFSPELSLSMNTTDVSMTPSAMASTQALSSNTMAPFSPELSSSMDVSMTPSGMASTRSNTVASLSPGQSPLVNSPQVSTVPFASTMDTDGSVTSSLPLSGTEASAGLSEIAKKPSTSLKTASSAAQTTSAATLPSSSATDDAETHTSRPVEVSSTPAEPVATPTTSPVTESHQEPMGPQDRKLLKLYADRGQLIHDAYARQINGIENNNARAMQMIEPSYEEIEINDRIYLKWPLQRLLCCAHGLRAMDRQLRDNFLTISSLAQQCIRYDASHDQTINPGMTDGHPAREVIIADLVNQFLNMYAQYGEARFNMIKATGFPMEETAESEIFQGFNARSMDSTVNALLHQPSGLSAPFRDVLQGLADSLGHEPQANDLRAPRPDRHLLQVIHNTTVADDEFTLPQARLDPGDMAATNRIIRAEQAHFIANMRELEDRRHFPVDYPKIFQNPADYEAVFQDEDTIPCHRAEPGLADTSALARLLSPPQLSTSPTHPSQTPTAPLEVTL